MDFNIRNDWPWVVGLVLFGLPYIIGAVGRHRHSPAILVLMLGALLVGIFAPFVSQVSLFLGAVVWWGALVWACCDCEAPRPAKDDPQPAQSIGPMPPAPPPVPAVNPVEPTKARFLVIGRKDGKVKNFTVESTDRARAIADTVRSGIQIVEIHELAASPFNPVNENA